MNTKNSQKGQNASTTTTGGLKLFWAACEYEIVVEKLQWKDAATTLAVGIQEASLNCGERLAESNRADKGHKQCGGDKLPEQRAFDVLLQW